MLVGIAVTGLLCAGLATVLARRTGASWAWSLALLLWSLAAIVITLVTWLVDNVLGKDD